MSRRSRDPRQQVLLGLLMAGLGLLFLLDNFHVFELRSMLPFWPLVFVALGVFKMAQPGAASGRVVGAALIAVGGLLTLRHLGWLDFRWRDFWPLLLIGGGLLVMFRGRLGWVPGDSPVEVLTQDHVQMTAIMSGHQTRLNTQQFSGGEVTVVMGGVELDLRQASIEGQATLKVFVLMGGLVLKLPLDWSVTIQGSPLLAGIEDRTVPPLMSSKRLVIQGEVMLGGIELRN